MLTGSKWLFKKTFDLWGMRFGLSHDLIHIEGDPYLERWILWAGGTIRIHKFYRGDQDRALHDHPWSFITFPFQGYHEDYWDGLNVVRRYVAPFRFHFRTAEHRHIVYKTTPGPTYTLFMNWFKRNEWGFWPDPLTFIHHKEWNHA